MLAITKFVVYTALTLSTL